MAENESHHRMVNPHQRTTDGMALLAVNFSNQNSIRNAGQPAGPELKLAGPHEEQSQRRVQRNSENRGDGHGEVLGEGQRLEKPSLLRLQDENRQEGDGYY